MTKVQAAVEAVGASGAPCLFCGGAATVVGAFAPTAPAARAAAGAPAGKVRVLFYPVCAGCAEYTRRHLAAAEWHILLAFGADQRPVGVVQ